LYNIDGSTWKKDTIAYKYHTKSVEDLQFSPVDKNQLASCSVDGTLRLADLREPNTKKSHTTIQAHNSDVNVLSWNRKSPNLIATGADDGSFKVWDKRYLDTSITEI